MASLESVERGARDDQSTEQCAMAHQSARRSYGAYAAGERLLVDRSLVACVPGELMPNDRGAAMMDHATYTLRPAW